MPFAPPHICACGNIVPAGQRCQCQLKRDAARKARHDHRRPSARQRGYDHTWERAAKAFLAEPGNARCSCCGAPATCVAHIVSIRKRPDLRMVPANWRPSCARCNALDAVADRVTP
jgi:hypothetical protein